MGDVELRDLLIASSRGSRSGLECPAIEGESPVGVTLEDAEEVRE